MAKASFAHRDGRIQEGKVLPNYTKQGLVDELVKQAHVKSIIEGKRGEIIIRTEMGIWTIED